ncbi:hypothetical protein PEDI_34380 [Persicobacter diffluens]|uniref:Uncharacterized protein n=1 Tax=Persicobacter diffluens TaxID=981 RepID=A0AAN4VZG0_9BACT|nr:hypothetical protein PEDI_34380 [Persicobacter diffluens]
MTDLVENNVIRIAVSFSHIIGGLLGIYMIFAEFIYLAQLAGLHLIYFFFRYYSILSLHCWRV